MELKIRLVSVDEDRAHLLIEADTSAQTILRVGDVVTVTVTPSREELQEALDRALRESGL